MLVVEAAGIAGLTAWAAAVVVVAELVRAASDEEDEEAEATVVSFEAAAFAIVDAFEAAAFAMVEASAGNTGVPRVEPQAIICTMVMVIIWVTVEARAVTV